MVQHMHNDQQSLTKNQALVFGALNEASGPLSAYSILDQLRDKGFRAPLQVYRALDKLLELGHVHRLESLNAFVACQHAECQAGRSVAFAICNDCGDVQEIKDRKLSDQLAEVAADANFQLEKSTVELRGLCGRCEPTQSST